MRIFYVLCRWKALLLLRGIRHNLLRTPLGWFLIFNTLLFVPALSHVLTRGLFADAAIPSALRSGIVVWGHIGLTLGFIFLFSGALVEAFVGRRAKEPIAVHSFCLQYIAVYRLFIAALVPSELFALLIFYFLYGRAITSIGPASRRALGAHALVVCFYLFAVAVPLAGLTRWLLARPGALARANLMQRLLSILLALSVFSFVAMPLAMQKWSPGRLEALGPAARSGLWWGQVPLAVFYALIEARYLSAAGWLASLACLVAIGCLMVRRWLQVAPREIILDFTGERTVLRDDAFARPLFRYPFRRFPATALFWVKDTLLQYLRSPARYVQLQIALISAVYLFFTSIYFVRKSYPSASLGETLLCRAAILAVAAILAMLRCLSSLGSEGSNLGLLRPALSSAQLLIFKSAPNFVYCLVHSAAYAVLVALLGQYLNQSGITILEGLGLALHASIEFVAFGMTIGFLFPDMERKAVFLPGASLFSKYLYLATSVWLLGLRSVLYLAHHHGYLSPGTLAAANVLFTLLATGACGLIIFCSLHRLERLEI